MSDQEQGIKPGQGFPNTTEEIIEVFRRDEGLTIPIDVSMEMLRSTQEIMKNTGNICGPDAMALNAEILNQEITVKYAATPEELKNSPVQKGTVARFRETFYLQGVLIGTDTGFCLIINLKDGFREWKIHLRSANPTPESKSDWDEVCAELTAETSVWASSRRMGLTERRIHRHKVPPKLTPLLITFLF
jgi:hypothetical protein